MWGWGIPPPLYLVSKISFLKDLGIKGISGVLDTGILLLTAIARLGGRASLFVHWIYYSWLDITPRHGYVVVGGWVRLGWGLTGFVGEVEIRRF
jgi:hypothetical protein